MKKFFLMLTALIGAGAVKVEDNKVVLTDEGQADLNTQLGEDDAALLISQVNEELAGVASAKEQLAQVKQSLAQKESEVEEKTKETETKSAQISALESKVSDLQNKVAVLGQAPDKVVETVSTVAGAIGAGLHKVFEVGGQLMGYEGKFWATDRPWNARALSGAQGSTTDFRSSAAIEKLNEEYCDFLREYPEKLEALFAKYFNLPEFWPRIYGVADTLMSATIAVGEVTQTRKPKWAPKGDVVIKPEEMKVRPTQIDLQFNYWEMQKIETNWLNWFNKEGSQAYKMTFIEFLLSEFLKKARQEDADVLIKGVFVANDIIDQNPQKSSSYLFRNDGLLKLIFDARNAGKYAPFNLGIVPSYANAVDYVDAMINSLPDAVKLEPLQYIAAPTFIKNYKRRYEELYAGNTDYSGYPQTPKDYTNITFVPLNQLEGSDVMIITTMDNIKVLEYKPEEKSLFTIEKFLRDVYAFADYKMGIGINHIGLPVAGNDPQRLVKQAIWTNNTPLFNPNFFATAYDYKNGILEVRHNRVKPDVDFTTNITKIEGNVGEFLIIRGDVSMGTAVNVVDSADINLTGDASFNLKSGGDLTLVKKADGKWYEVSRTSAPATAVETTKAFTTDTIAYDADQYIYTGSGAITLAAITGGAEGNTVRIYGGVDVSNQLTVADKATIDVVTSYAMDDPAKYIDLVYVNGKWTEFGRG